MDDPKRKEARDLLGLTTKDSKLQSLNLFVCFKKCSNKLRRLKKCSCDQQKIYKEIRFQFPKK